MLWPSINSPLFPHHHHHHYSPVTSHFPSKNQTTQTKMASMPVAHNDSTSPSFKDKLKSSISCFGSHSRHEVFEPEDVRKSHSPRSPRSWLRSTAHDLEIRDRCLGLIGRKGKNRRRYNSTDFSYDPASYSMNFEDGINKEDELPLSYFRARFPATPEAPVGRVRRPEVVAWS